MEKQRKSCRSCGEVVEIGRYHHSKEQGTLCSACFRLYLKQSVEDEVKAKCESLRESISALGCPLPSLPPSQEIAVDKDKLQGKFTILRIAVGIQRAEILGKIRRMDRLNRDINDQNQQLRALAMERIYRKYRLNCVVPLEQVRLFLCTDCVLRLEAPPRRFVQSNGSDGQTNQMEAGCCSSKCECM